MATKPDEMIKWCEDNPAGRIQPPLASEQGGYPKNAVPPFQWVNWKFWNIARWIAWLEEQASRTPTMSEQVKSLEILGSGATTAWPVDGVQTNHIQAQVDGSVLYRLVWEGKGFPLAFDPYRVFTLDYSALSVTGFSLRWASAVSLPQPGQIDGGALQKIEDLPGDKAIKLTFTEPTNAAMIRLEFVGVF